MNKKSRIYIILTGVVAITLVWLSQSNRGQIPELESLLEENAGNNAAEEEPIGTLEGTLWSSDDEARGNLMLINNAATVYIRTSRDFSGLVGKYVIVSIDGTLENFILLNIEEHLTRNGYIKVE